MRQQPNAQYRQFIDDIFWWNNPLFPSVCYVGPYETRKLALSKLEPEFNCFVSDADKMFVNKTLEQVWLHDAPVRWPFQHASLLEFCLATADYLPPYCVLWIFQYIPFTDLFSELKRIAAIEKIVASIRHVRSLRFKRPRTQSVVPRLANIVEPLE